MKTHDAITIDSDYIKLDSLLKLANLVMSGGEAKLLIMDGQVMVNGQVETRRGRKLYPGDRIRCVGRKCVALAAQ
jgi:ribosome-associated protein